MKLSLWIIKKMDSYYTFFLLAVPLEFSIHQLNVSVDPKQYSYYFTLSARNENLNPIFHCYYSTTA